MLTEMGPKAQHTRAAQVAGIGLMLACALIAQREPVGILPSAVASPVMDAWISGNHFLLEIADNPAQFDKGLGGRDQLEPFGGMVFVFPSAEPEGFVMRDCPFALDILFLDDEARVLCIDTMQAEPARRQMESEEDYSARLKIYFCERPARFVIETAAGSARARPGDIVRIDTLALTRRSAGKG